MNEQTETQLRIAVERIVRPVRASHPRKLLMREELLGHLTAVFEEECARQEDEPAAVAGAVARLGEPAALSQELQRSLPWYERHLMTCLDPNRSAAWHVRQMIPGLVVAHLLVFLFMGWLFWRLSPAQFWSPEASRFPGLAFLVSSSMLACIAGFWGMVQFCGALYGMFGVRRSLGQAVALVLAVMVLAEIAVMGFLPFAAGVPVTQWPTSPLVVRSALFPGLPMALLMGLTYPLSAYSMRLELRQVQRWHQLPLGET